MKSTFLSLTSLLVLTGSLFAGGKQPQLIVQPPPEAPSIEWEAAVGYDTDYIFRGEALQTNTPWVELSLDIPLSDSLSWNITPWYLHDADSDFNEFDLNSSFSYSLGKYEFELGYSSYYYPRGGEGDGFGVGDEQEFFVGVSHDILTFTANALAVYNIGRDGYYFELGVEQPYVFNDTVSVELSGALGFDSGYYGDDFDINHALVTLSFPVNLAENVVLTPYVAGNFPLGPLDEGDAQVFGGVRLAISF